ncbi:MAG: hypothetical protein AAFQ98_23555 [Bacteroidota bacterium]
MYEYFADDELSREMRVLLEEMNSLMDLLNRNLQEIDRKLASMVFVPEPVPGHDVYLSPELELVDYLEQMN